MADQQPAKPRVRVRAGSQSIDHAQPTGRYFHGERSSFFIGWRPNLRESAEDLSASWDKAAARVIESYQNSGFVRGLVEISTSQVVGTGLRMSSRPDAHALGWDAEYAADFARRFESGFRAWAENPYECDASGQFKFGEIQQAYYWSGMSYGEGLALLPFVKRPGSAFRTKVKLLPPSRIVAKSDGANVVQGVKIDSWGMPLSIFLRERDPAGFETEREIRVRDNDGRPLVIHNFMPAIAVTRGISDLVSGMKPHRQFDQYSDANLTKKLIQNIFAATIKSNINGMAAFEGLMTEDDGAHDPRLDLSAFGEAKGEWYDGAKVDLAQHGRIAHLFPNDELTFTEFKSNADDFDNVGRWLNLELAAAAGVSYETATGDYRGATYSSVRMAGAKEWLNVLRKRKALVEPLCQAAAEAWLEEAIATGRMECRGGLDFFLRNKSLIARCNWTGPRQPQADDFKTARAYQVLKEMGAATLSGILADYGEDWDEVLRQQHEENEMARRLGLPLPWAPREVLQDDRSSAQRKAPANSDPDSPEGLNQELENEIEASIRTDGDGD